MWMIIAWPLFRGGRSNRQFGQQGLGGQGFLRIFHIFGSWLFSSWEAVFWVVDVGVGGQEVKMLAVGCGGGVVVVVRMWSRLPSSCQLTEEPGGGCEGGHHPLAPTHNHPKLKSPKMTTIKEPLSSPIPEVKHAFCIQLSKGVGLVLAAHFRNEMIWTLFADSIISCSRNMNIGHVPTYNASCLALSWYSGL